MGLSMGGTLALRWPSSTATTLPGWSSSTLRSTANNKLLFALPALKSLVPSLKGIANDIAKPGEDEGGYERVPLKALHSLTEGWALVRRDTRRSQPCCAAVAVDHVS